MSGTNGQHESNELLKQILSINEETLTLQRVQFKLFEEEIRGLKQSVNNIEKVLVQNTEAINSLGREMRTLRSDFNKMFDHMQTNQSKLEERLKRVEDKVFLG